MKNYKLHNVFSRKVITEKLKATDAEGVIRELVELLVANEAFPGSVVDDLVAELLAREREGSTGIGGGVAIPHIRTDLIDDVLGAIGRSEKGIDFNAVDGEPVYLFFLFFAPLDQADVHLDILKKISSMVRNKLYCQFMRKARKKAEIHDVLKEFEEGA
ncbi:MAG: PTS sugar transporter subunit IIA [Planctomycetes bacterium]|nr:PTS sugar transporter subunit IIA [Planctomycetota bacterium]